MSRYYFDKKKLKGKNEKSSKEKSFFLTTKKLELQKNLTF